MNKKRQTN